MNPNASQDRTLEFIAAYLLEKSLSVDNLFVFIMIFQKFKISNEHQPDVLKWGIIGALILRAIMILSGAALVAKFSWILYFFGAFLIYTAVKIYIHRNEEEEEDDEEGQVAQEHSELQRTHQFRCDNPEAEIYAE